MKPTPAILIQLDHLITERFKIMYIYSPVCYLSYHFYHSSISSAPPSDPSFIPSQISTTFPARLVILVIVSPNHSIPNHSQQTPSHNRHRRLNSKPLGANETCRSYKHKPGLTIQCTATLNLAGDQTYAPQSIHCSEHQSYGTAFNALESGVQQAFGAHDFPEG